MRNFLSKSVKIAEDIFPYHEKKKAYHFAFAWKRNKLLGIGQNQTEKMSGKALKFARRFNSKKQKKYPYLHSEIDLVSRLWGREYIDNKINIVVVRLNTRLELQNSKPCKGCLPILLSLNTNIWYSTPKGIMKHES